LSEGRQENVEEGAEDQAQESATRRRHLLSTRVVWGLDTESSFSHKYTLFAAEKKEKKHREKKVTHPGLKNKSFFREKSQNTALA
jgi:hypothetical protein